MIQVQRVNNKYQQKIKKMLKGKKSKKKEDSQESFDIDDIVDSQEQDLSRSISYPKGRQISSSNKKMNQQVIKSEKNQSKIVPTGQKLTISQIKKYIQTQIPEMKQQIEEMDDQSLREIYQSVNQSNLNQDTEQQTKTNRIQNFEEQKINDQNQGNTVLKFNKRHPQIQFMFDQIIKSVPHMKDQVQMFDDEQIRQLYQTVIGPQNNQSNTDKSNNGPISNGSSLNIQEIKKFLSQKIPSMKNQLNYLSNEDILQVYQKYSQKDKPTLSNKPSNYPSYMGSSNKYTPGHIKNITKNPYQAFDSSSIYSNSVKSGVKLEPRLNYGIDQQERYYGQFNNYKYGNGNQRLPSSTLNGSSHFSSNFNPQLTNNLQFHTFHNNQRVHGFPYNHQKYARTVVIFHTMDPGYIPPASKSSCQCPCCLKRQHGMNDENPLNSFIFEMMKKYSSKK